MSIKLMSCLAAKCQPATLVPVKRQNHGCGDPYRCASAYCSISNEDELKTHIRSKGEQVNVPLAFLMDTSQDTVIQPRKNGKRKTIVGLSPSRIFQQRWFNGYIKVTV